MYLTLHYISFQKSMNVAVAHARMVGHALIMSIHTHVHAQLAMKERIVKLTFMNVAVVLVRTVELAWIMSIITHVHVQLAMRE